MNLLRVLSDGLILTGITVGASLLGGSFFKSRSDNSKLKRSTLMCYIVAILYTVFSVYFIYRHQENSDFFFWHPYFAWTIANVVYIILKMRNNAALKKNGSVVVHVDLSKDNNDDADSDIVAMGGLMRLLLIRVALWQLVVITAFSGFALSVGWLMKLYIR